MVRLVFIATPGIDDFYLDTCHCKKTIVRGSQAYMLSQSDVVDFAGPLVFNAIRAVHPNTPILIFGGTYDVGIGCQER